MNISELKYKTKSANEEEIYLHLKECNDNFVPPLKEKVNLREYSKKLFEKSVTFEAWADQQLIGLVASYFNTIENHLGYITNVSITKKYQGKGIASTLMNKCIQYAQQNNFKEISLEVHKDNRDAIQLYKKFGFTDIKNNNDLIVMKLRISKL